MHVEVAGKGMITFRLFNLLHISSRKGCQAFLSMVFIIFTKMASKIAAHMVCKGIEIFSSSSAINKKRNKRIICTVQNDYHVVEGV